MFFDCCVLLFPDELLLDSFDCDFDLYLLSSGDAIDWCASFAADFAVVNDWESSRDDKFLLLFDKLLLFS